MDSMERKEQDEKHDDERKARLRKLGMVIEQWERNEGDAGEAEVENYYNEVGRLRSRLEETRIRLEELREPRDDWERLREEIDQAITELEEAIARAAPRFQ